MQRFREEKISKSELFTVTAEEGLYLLCFRSEGSGAKQCSGFEGKISKSELCTGTPKKYCIWLCFRSEGSSANQCSGSEKKKKQVRTMHWHNSRITVFIVCQKQR